MNNYKPNYHFCAPNHWMNDPNGPIQYKGEYHLFYQYNPFGDEWGHIHWGHAKSKDLVVWEHLPIALSPSLERGEEHCFSGCTVIHEGKPAILYTSIGPGERSSTSGAEQWLAWGSSDLLAWQKHEENPVLKQDVHGVMRITEWRDPFVWRHGQEWLMICGGSHDGRGCAVLYRSADLTGWTYVGILASGADPIWECPNFFELGGKYVLLYSPDTADNRIRYQIGDFSEDYRFTAEQEGILDYGGREGYYAPTTFLDESGRRILLGWMPETARGEFKGIEGWSGTHAVPRVMELEAGLNLKIRPLPELARLRKGRYILNQVPIQGVKTLGIYGRSLEISAVFDAASASAPFGIKFFCSPNGEEETILRFNPEEGTMELDRSRSSLHKDTHLFLIQAPLFANKKGLLHLHLYLDQSTVEVFVNKRISLSARVYPSLASSNQVGLFSEAEGIASLKFLSAWKLA